MPHRQQPYNSKGRYSVWILNNLPITSSTRNNIAARQRATPMTAKADIVSSIPIDLNSDAPQQSTDGFESLALIIRSSWPDSFIFLFEKKMFQYLFFEIITPDKVVDDAPNWHIWIPRHGNDVGAHVKGNLEICGDENVSDSGILNQYYWSWLVG